MPYDFEFMSHLQAGSKVGRISTDYDMNVRVDIQEVVDVTKETIKLKGGDIYFKRDGMRLGPPSYRAPRLISEARARKLMDKTGEDHSLTSLTLEVLGLFQKLPPQSPGNSRAELRKLRDAHFRASVLIDAYLTGGERQIEKVRENVVAMAS